MILYGISISFGGILTFDNVLITCSLELETKLKAYNDYFAENSKQQITLKNVSKSTGLILTRVTDSKLCLASNDYWCD